MVVMDIDELVQTIVREVLQRLQKSAAGEQILLLARRDDSKVAPVLQHFKQQVNVVFWDPTADVMIPERVVVPFLSCSQMADLAQGRATGALMKKVLDLLLAGKSVEVFDFEYLQFSKTAPEPLYRLYESYEAILHGFGLKRFSAETLDNARLKSRLVTERDVVEAHRQGVSILHVLPDALLTPLAVDCARERGVQIRKTER
jgi:ethanolamine utilization protein